jgi:hypothetical protein
MNVKLMNHDSIFMGVVVITCLVNLGLAVYYYRKMKKQEKEFLKILDDLSKYYAS